jgi:hypothetical protein
MSDIGPTEEGWARVQEYLDKHRPETKKLMCIECGTAVVYSDMDAMACSCTEATWKPVSQEETLDNDGYKEVRVLIGG